MTECQHILRPSIGVFFIGHRNQCIRCQLWEHEIKMGIGRAHELVTKHGEVLAYGSLDTCMTEARKLCIRKPARFKWYSLIDGRRVQIRYAKVAQQPEADSSPVVVSIVGRLPSRVREDRSVRVPRSQAPVEIEDESSVREREQSPLEEAEPRPVRPD